MKPPPTVRNDHGEVPKRLAPTKEVMGILFLMSGNRRAYPGCPKPIIGMDGLLDGEIAHIRSPIPDGPRWDPSRTNEQNRQLDNLLLLCNKHHGPIDARKNLAVWTTARLVSMKGEHEAKYTGAIDHLGQLVGDVTSGQRYVPAANADAMLGSDWTDEERQVNLALLNGLGKRLAALPPGPRSVLALAVKRGQVRGMGDVNDEVSVEFAILTAFAECDQEQLWDHIRVLEHANFGYIDADEFGAYPTRFVVAWSTPRDVGWPIFESLKKHDPGDGSIIDRVVIGLDLTVLDRP